MTNPFPITFDANAPFSPNGPFIVPPSDLDTTRVHSWNVSVQRQFGADMAVSASYIGNYTTNLWDVVTGNPGTIPGGGSPTGPCTLNTPTGPLTVANCSTRPSLDQRREITQLESAVGRFIGFLDYFTDHGTQKYNGLLLSVQRRAVNGISASANYTLSKCEGHRTQGGGTSNVGKRLHDSGLDHQPAGGRRGAARPGLRSVRQRPPAHLQRDGHRGDAAVRRTRRRGRSRRVAAVGHFPRGVRYAR